MRRAGYLVPLILASACGSEGTLSLRLLRAGFEDPFGAVGAYRVCSFDRGGVASACFNGARIGVELGALALAEQRLEVDGLDAEQAVVARGRSRFLRPRADNEELVPFSTIAVAAALPAGRALRDPFLVDGYLDEWQASPSLVLTRDHRVAGSTDERAELFLAWTADELRLALLFADSCPALYPGEPAGGCGVASQLDRVSLGVNGSGGRGASYGAGDFWVEVTAGGVAVKQGALTPAELDVRVAALPDGAGWALEGVVRVSALGRTSLSSQDRVGFDVVLWDEDPSRDEPTVLRWSGGTRSPGEPTAPARMGTIGFAQ